MVASLLIQAIPPLDPDSKSFSRRIWRTIKRYATRRIKKEKTKKLEEEERKETMETSKRKEDFIRQISVEFMTPDGGHDNKLLQCLIDTGTEGPGMINEDSLPLLVTKEQILALDDRGPAYSVVGEPIDLVGMIDVHWAGSRYGLVNFPRSAITTRLYVARNIEYDIFGRETILDRGFLDKGYLSSAAGYYRRVAPPPQPAKGAEMEKALAQSEKNKINYDNELAAAARQRAQLMKSSLSKTSTAGSS